MDVNTCTAHSSQLQGGTMPARAHGKSCKVERLKGWYPDREYVYDTRAHTRTQNGRRAEERRRRGKAGYPAPASSEREYDA